MAVELATDARDATLDLFSEDHIQRMTHHCARATEVAAAVEACKKRGAVHELILQAFREHGPMTDEQLEQLPQFAKYAPSTVRCRRVDLSHPKRAGSHPPIVQDGITERPGRTPMTRWRLNE